MAVYVLDDNNNKIEALDKEGVLAAIEEAIRNGSLAGLVADAGFISKLKCCVSGDTNKMGFITQAKYNELVANNLVDTNTLYFIYDDKTAENIDTQLVEINKYINTELTYIKKYISGEKPVPVAEDARNVGGVPTGFLLVSENGQLTNKVYNAVMADTATNSTSADTAKGLSTTLITNRDSNGWVPITKTGLYALNITFTNSINQTIRFTTLISVESLANDINNTYNDGTYTVQVSYDKSSNKFTAHNTLNDNKASIESCRLLIAY